MADDIMWKDKLVTELSRDELIEVVHWAFGYIKTERDMHGRTLDMWKTCREARKQ